MPQTPLPIVFALHDADGRYWLNAAVAMTSVIHHSSRPLAVHVLHDETLTDEARRRLSEIAAALAAPISFVTLDLPATDFRALGKFSPASAFRLKIPNLFPDEDLVIYLDADLVVNGLDIAELAAVVPAEAPLAAVPDRLFGQSAVHAKYASQLGLDLSRYFNSGVLAIRPSLLPTTLLEEFAAFVSGGAPLVHPDQDFLNLKYGAAAHLLEERFNTPVGNAERRALRPLSFYSGRVVHYVGELKPLRGLVSPAFIPFLVHSFLTPEVHQGRGYDPNTYLFPAEGMPHQVRGRPIGRDPGADAFFAQLAKLDPGLPTRLKGFLQGLRDLRVFPNFLGPMEIGWQAPGGFNVVVATVGMDGRVTVGNEPALAAAALARHHDELAGLGPLTLQGLLARDAEWRAAIARLQNALT